MAAATVNARREWVAGNKRIVAANLTVANTNTWDTKLGVIDSVSVVPTTAAACGVTTSGGTVTFVTGGGLTVECMVQGA